MKVWLFLTCTVLLIVCAEAKDDFCQNMIDDVYSDGCSPIYYICISKTTTKTRCPNHPNGDLYYNSEKRMCDYKDEVPECNPTSIQSDPDIQGSGDGIIDWFSNERNEVEEATLPPNLTDLLAMLGK